MLPKQHRLTRADEFRVTMRKGRRRSGSSVMTHIAPLSPEAPARFGFVVSKAVGNAVTRNRVRRRLRAVAAESVATGLRGADVVVRALPVSALTSFPTLRADLLGQLESVSGTGRA